MTTIESVQSLFTTLINATGIIAGRAVRRPVSARHRNGPLQVSDGPMIAHRSRHPATLSRMVTRPAKRHSQ